MYKFPLKKLISPLLTLAVLALFGIYLYNNPQIVETVINTPIIYILVISVFFLLLFLLEGIFIKITLKVFNKDIDIKESYFLSTISRIGNYLLPLRAGAIFRATYLKNKYQFKYSKFLSTLYAYYILLFLINALLALLTLSIKYLTQRVYYPLVTIFFLLLFVTTLTVVLFRKKIGIKKIKEFKLVKILNRFIVSWDTIIKKSNMFLLLLLITFGNIFLNALIYTVEFLSLGIKINILDIILYTCLSGVSLLISITPGSLGLREAVFLITSESIGLQESQIMELALLDRGILFILLLLLLILILLFVRRFKLRDIFFAKEDKE